MDSSPKYLVQNHREAATKADARVMLTDALEEHSALTTQKAQPSPLESSSAPPFQMPDPLSCFCHSA